MTKLCQYKHRKCLDVGFIPLQIKEDSQGLTLFGWWFLLRNDNILHEDTIFIKKDDIYKWNKLDGYVSY